jgi:hypothetical protein
VLCYSREIVQKLVKSLPAFQIVSPHLAVREADLTFEELQRVNANGGTNRTAIRSRMGL